MGNILSEIIHNLDQSKNIKRIEGSNSETIITIPDGNHDGHNTQSSASQNHSNPKFLEKIVKGVFNGAKGLHDTRTKFSSKIQKNGKIMVERIRAKSRSRTPPRGRHGMSLSKHRKLKVTLLWGTTNTEEHYEKIELICSLARSLKGKEGLKKIGFEYRRKYCEKHGGKILGETLLSSDPNIFYVPNKNLSFEPKVHFEEPKVDLEASPIESLTTETKVPEPISLDSSDNDNESSSITSGNESTENMESLPQNNHEALYPLHSTCYNCATRLYHVQSNTYISEENRKEYIADGEMYEVIAGLCQEVAHEMMIQEGQLEWITICDGEGSGSSEPIRALVTQQSSSIKHQYDAEYRHNIFINNDRNNNGGYGRDDNHDHPNTLLVSTGKGKVRAGIFSRQHLITTGVEASTALPFVREAHIRNMHMVILDPNARGEREGMITFEKSLKRLFHIHHHGHHKHKQSQKLSQEQPHNNDPIPSTLNSFLRNDSLYVLAHSQGGAQLVRYLRELETESLVPKIKSIAFTDSTHNIQWVKEKHELRSLLESTHSLYIKSSNVRHDDGWENHVMGEQVETDHYWEHRFGKIKTVWAGTKEHSLTNWVAKDCIWDHFDCSLEHSRESTIPEQ